MKKLVWVLLWLLIPLKIFGQIKVDQVGDDWQPQVYKALELIKNTDTTTYSFVLKHCHRISFWSGEFSTVEGDKTITGFTIYGQELDTNASPTLAIIVGDENDADGYLASATAGGKALPTCL